MQILKNIAFIFIFSLILVSCSSQEEKLRDTSRFSSLKAAQADIENYYQKDAKYPDTYNFLYGNDPLYGKSDVSEECSKGFIYEVKKNKEGIANQCYIISSCMEKNNEIMKTDGGINDKRFEIVSSCS